MGMRALRMSAQGALLAGLMLAAAPIWAVEVRWTDTATVAARDAGWGRMTRLTDGRWLAVTTRFHKDWPTTLALSVSDDHARSWQPWSELAEPGRKIDNGEVLALPDGRVLLAMRSLVDGVSYRLHLYASDDGARSWRFLSVIDQNETPGGRNDRGVWEPVLTLLDDGTLSVLYADETLADGQPAYNQVVSQRLSRDGGRSWESRAVIAAQPGGSALRPGMPVMARRPQGGYVLVFEICGEDKHCPVSSKISPDGRSWPAGLGTPLADQRCGPQITTTTRGTMFVTSCQNEISVSEDGGGNWQRLPEPAWPIGFRHSWPAVYEIAPDEIGVINVTEGGRVQIRFGTY